MSEYSRPKIVNIVANGQFPKTFDLDKLYSKLNVNQKQYEPETYPGLIVKVGKNNKSVTLYRNGKYIIAGPTSKKELMDTFEEISKKLREVGALD